MGIFLYLSLRLIFHIPNDTHPTKFHFNHHKSGTRLLLSSPHFESPLLNGKYEWTLVNDVDGYRGQQVHIDANSKNGTRDSSPVMVEDNLKSTMDKFADVNSNPFASPHTQGSQTVNTETTDTFDRFFHQDELYQSYVSSTNLNPEILTHTQQSPATKESGIDKFSKLISQATNSDALPLS